MYQGKTIFSQIMDFLPIKKFRKCVDRYNGNKGVRTFSCWDQFLCMTFAQLTYRESLRDIECCLRSMRERLYHMGIKKRYIESYFIYNPICFWIYGLFYVSWVLINFTSPRCWCHIICIFILGDTVNFMCPFYQRF